MNTPDLFICLGLTFVVWLWGAYKLRQPVEDHRGFAIIAGTLSFASLVDLLVIHTMYL